MRILTANQTAFELEEHKPALAFFPIGATEQHSRHLPLATDTILAETLSSEILVGLDWPGCAYLLPVLPISSSEENTGYKGTISFTPTTIRAIVRDTFRSLSEVGIEQLVVCPWHGGNFILKPVVRELNQELGRCGLFYLNPWEHVPQSVYAEFAPGFEVHCGDVETSLMMAIAPELVKADRKDNPLPDFLPAWQDMWSMKTISAGEGHLGHPSEASLEKGETFRTAVIEYSTRYLQQLLNLSKKYDRY